tara:strand:+ start:80 stop:1564 length:1485 start_codon:yes stop_codon:yes gene_type:complete
MNQIVKNFNNLVKKTIFKVQNKTNNKFKISNFNRYLIGLIGTLFIYLFYLLIPLLYEKSWVQNSIERKLLNEFKINLSASADISYQILPAPHFLIKDSKILVNDLEKQKSIAEIKNLKVFLGQGNFFNKDAMNLKKVVINDANFSFLTSDFKLWNKFSNNKFSNKKIEINKSNIFLKDHLGDIILIIKIDKTTLFFDDKKSINLLNLKGKIFNIPFTFDIKNQNNIVKNEEMHLYARPLKLNIFNKFTKKMNNSGSGKNNISFLNSNINTKYDIKDKLIIFVSENSKINNSKIDYSGKLSLNPFDLVLDINLGNDKISKLFNDNSILLEFIKSELLFNDNISISTSTVIRSNSKKDFFQDANINFHIVNGKINFDKTRFVNDDIGSLELINSNLFLENNKLVLNGDLLLDIENSDRLFSFLNTGKLSRKKIRKILINLDYVFLSNRFEFNNIKIDGKEVSDQLLTIMDSFSDNNLNNFNKSRRLINELLKVYEG